MNRYELLETVGEGTYGVVFKCRQRSTGKIVAVKRFKNFKANAYIRCTMMRELRTQQLLKGEPYVVQLMEAFKENDRLFLVMEYIPSSLLDVLDRNPKGLKEEDMRLLMYTLLLGVCSCHRNGIIHRDIKPENILVKENGTASLCDFGFCRPMARGTEMPSQSISAATSPPATTLLSSPKGPSANPSQSNGTGTSSSAVASPMPPSNAKLPPGGFSAALDDLVLADHVNTMTDYVATRWYRSPEMLLGMSQYSYAVDMWAVGAIMAESVDGEPLLPGKSELEQLGLIQTRVGELPGTYQAAARSRNCGVLRLREAKPQNKSANGGLSITNASSLQATCHTYLENRFRSRLSENAMDLLRRLLCIDAAERITVEEALQHPFFDGLREKIEGQSSTEGALTDVEPYTKSPLTINRAHSAASMSPDKESCFLRKVSSNFSTDSSAPSTDGQLISQFDGEQGEDDSLSNDDSLPITPESTDIAPTKKKETKPSPTADGGVPALSATAKCHSPPGEDPLSPPSAAVCRSGQIVKSPTPLHAIEVLSPPKAAPVAKPLLPHDNSSSPATAASAQKKSTKPRLSGHHFGKLMEKAKVSRITAAMPSFSLHSRGPGASGGATTSPNAKDSNSDVCVSTTTTAAAVSPAQSPTDRKGQPAQRHSPTKASSSQPQGAAAQARPHQPQQQQRSSQDPPTKGKGGLAKPQQSQSSMRKNSMKAEPHCQKTEEPRDLSPAQRGRRASGKAPSTSATGARSGSSSCAKGKRTPRGRLSVDTKLPLKKGNSGSGGMYGRFASPTLPQEVRPLPKREKVTLLREIEDLNCAASKSYAMDGPTSGRGNSSEANASNDTDLSAIRDEQMDSKRERKPSDSDFDTVPVPPGVRAATSQGKQQTHDGRLNATTRPVPLLKRDASHTRTELDISDTISILEFSPDGTTNEWTMGKANSSPRGTNATQQNNGRPPRNSAHGATSTPSGQAPSMFFRPNRMASSPLQAGALAAYASSCHTVEKNGVLRGGSKNSSTFSAPAPDATSTSLPHPVEKPEPAPAPMRHAESPEPPASSSKSTGRQLSSTRFSAAAGAPMLGALPSVWGRSNSWATAEEGAARPLTLSPNTEGSDSSKTPVANRQLRLSGATLELSVSADMCFALSTHDGTSCKPLSLPTPVTLEDHELDVEVLDPSLTPALKPVVPQMVEHHFFDSPSHPTSNPRGEASSSDNGAAMTPKRSDQDASFSDEVVALDDLHTPSANGDSKGDLPLAMHTVPSPLQAFQSKEQKKKLVTLTPPTPALGGIFAQKRAPSLHCHLGNNRKKGRLVLRDS